MYSVQCAWDNAASWRWEARKSLKLGQTVSCHNRYPGRWLGRPPLVENGHARTRECARRRVVFNPSGWLLAGIHVYFRKTACNNLFDQFGKYGMFFWNFAVCCVLVTHRTYPCTPSDMIRHDTIDIDCCYHATRRVRSGTCVIP